MLLLASGVKPKKHVYFGKLEQVLFFVPGGKPVEEVSFGK